MEKQSLNLKALLAGNIWEYLVGDFLETACFLSIKEQACLIEELQRQKIQAESIDVHPCFSINGKVIVVCEKIAPKECWLFFTKHLYVQKYLEAAPYRLQQI